MLPFDFVTAMPTFTAIAFDRLIEPGTSKSVDKSAPSSMPVPNPKLDRRSSVPSAKKKAPRPPLKPALYTTPEVTPLPDSPSSFPPSPYIINHKRRGPRLQKSFSEANVQSTKIPDDETVNGELKNSGPVVVSSAGDLQVTSSNPEPVKDERANGIHDSEPLKDEHANGIHDCDPSRNNNGNSASGLREAGRESNITKVVAHNSERDGETEDFFDPQESMSYTSNTDGEDNSGKEHFAKTPAQGEFYDAWEGNWANFTDYLFRFSSVVEHYHRELACVLSSSWLIIQDYGAYLFCFFFFSYLLSFSYHFF